MPVSPRSYGNSPDGIVEMVTGDRVGVFGGTFDPVHIGHLVVAEVMRVQMSLDSVLFLPAGRPPHKPQQVLSSDDDRVAMLELALADAPHFSICRLDIDRTGPSYTADTVQILQRDLLRGSELYFLMGQDSLRDFPTWHDPERIVAHTRIGVAMRPGIGIDLNDIYAAIPEARGRIELQSIPLIGVSSRGIRREVRRGGAYRFQVLPVVADYIEARSLYRGSDSENTIG